MDKEIAPADPEVLWSVPYDQGSGWCAFQIRADGSVWFSLNGPWGEVTWEEVNLAKSHPALRELTRRLLAERAEQERLDDHNDRLEEEGYPTDDLGKLERRLNIHTAQIAELRAIEGRLAALEKEDTDRTMLAGRVQELDANLAREIGRVALLESRSFRVNERLDAIEARTAPPSLGVTCPPPPREVVAALRDSGIAEEVTERVEGWGGPPHGKGLAWERGYNCMVNPEGIVFDLSDYDNLSPRDHDLLEKLADLWNAWGPEGYLRRLLLAQVVLPASEEWAWWRDHPDFRQLRSELLAKPWKEGA